MTNQVEVIRGPQLDSSWILTLILHFPRRHEVLLLVSTTA